MSWLAACLAGFLSGTAGALGLGGGGVLLIYLTVFASVPQIQAQGINLIFFLPCALLAVVLHARKGLIVWRAVVPCAAMGLLGAWAGSALADVLGPTLLSKLFALFLVALGLKEVFARKGHTQKSTAETVLWRKHKTRR